MRAWDNEEDAKSERLRITKVDKGVPIPKPAPRPMIYPWLALQVGDSFFAPRRSEAQEKGFYVCAKKQRLRITVRAVTEDGIAGYRIWRVA